MPKVRDHVDPRVQNTLAFIKDNPKATLPQAMRAAEFTNEESKTPKFQMLVRRRLRKEVQKHSNASKDAAPPSSRKETVQLPPDLMKPKRTRATATQIMQIRQNDAIQKKRHSYAFKLATTMYAEERKKPNGLSARGVSNKVLEKTGIEISPRTIQHYVNKLGAVGTSPVKNGRPSNIPDDVYKQMADAFASFIQIKQINAQGGSITRDKLMKLLKECTSPSSHECNCTALLDRLLKSTAIDLKSGRNNSQEERRVRWTTYENLEKWYNSWERDLVKLGFATLNEKGEAIIPPEQLARIINIDETALVMDASTSQRGGRPAVTFYNPSLPNLGYQKIKNSQSITMITGSNAAGEAIPPHFQFPTASKSPDTEKIRIDFFRYIKGVNGKWGLPEEQAVLPTFGMNEKGGMDNKEFRDYVMTNLVPLYPDARNEDGKRVMIKVDSGPGRLNKDLLVELRLMGFYLYPGVPNTTAVTQETDQNYGPYKTKFVENLDEINDARISGGHSVSLPPWLVGLIVFGGTDPVSGHVIEEGAFDAGFSEERNLRSWQVCGAAPITRVLLNNHPKVRREFGDSDDEVTDMMRNLMSINSFSTHYLNMNGFNGDVFKSEIRKCKEAATRNLTQPLTEKRVRLLSKAKTHGQIFYATNGDACNSDDAFYAMELREREHELTELTKKKTKSMRMLGIETTAKQILEQATTVDDYNGKELKALLKWYQVKNVQKLKVQECRLKWNEIVANKKEPPKYEKWTSADEARLEELKKPFTLKDTALGRGEELVKRQFIGTVAKKLSKEERDELRKILDSSDGSDEAEDEPAAVSIMASLDMEEDDNTPSDDDDEGQVDYMDDVNLSAV